MQQTKTKSKDLFMPEALEEIFKRIDSLSADTRALWGKMAVDQMLAHCAATFEVATGQKTPKRGWLGYTLGPLFKHLYTNDKPFAKNTPTDPTFVVADRRNFEVEKERLKKLIQQFHEGGEAKVTKHPHSFFGKLTSWEWARGMYKHLDHHLRQFGA